MIKFIKHKNYNTEKTCNIKLLSSCKICCGAENDDIIVTSFCNKNCCHDFIDLLRSRNVTSSSQNSCHDFMICCGAETNEIRDQTTTSKTNKFR